MQVVDSLVVLYELRLNRRLNNLDVRKIFPSAKMLSDYISCVSRAKNLGLGVEDFKSACIGDLDIDDGAFNGSLRRVLLENGRISNGKS